MRYRQIVLIVGLLFGFSACSSPNSSNFGMGGVDSKMIGPAEAVVVVSGNAVTSRRRIENMLLARASKLTIAAGQKRFSLLTIEDAGAAKAIKNKTIVAYLRRKAASEEGTARLTSERKRLTVNGTPAGLHTRHGGGFFVVMYKNGRGFYDALKQNKRLAGFK